MMKMKNVAFLSITLLSLSLFTACGGGGDGNSAIADGTDGVADSGTDDGRDSGTDGGADSGTDGGRDSGTDGGADSGTDGGRDSGTDGGADSGTDGGADSGTDGGVDSGTDGGADSGTDGGADSGTDGGADSGTDGGADSGTDGGSDGGGGIVDASATVVYADGGPVAGIPDAVFTELNTSAMSSTGEVCISARYDQGDDRLQGVWCGAPGAQQQILRSGDTIDNLPANISFAGAGSMLFADNGNLLIAAILTGAVDGVALLIWDGASVNSIVRTGELAPGLSDGSVVNTLNAARLSDAGVVFLGTAGQPLFGWPVLWYWDGFEVSILAANRRIGLALPTDQNGCKVDADLSGLSTQLINNNGLISFVGFLSDTADSPEPELCRGTGVVQTDGNTFTTIVSTGNIVPSTETAEFGSLEVNELFDSGAMSITSLLIDDNASGLDIARLSTWIFRPDGSADLVTIVEESVPPGFVNRISLIADFPIVLTSSETTAVQWARTSLGDSLLAGAPHNGMPYPDIGAVGATTMSLIASTNSEPPEGFADDSFLSSFSRPAIDSSGRVFYRATIQLPSEGIASNAFYTAMAGQVPTLVFGNGSLVDYDGGMRVISNITLSDARPSAAFFFNNLPGFPISQQGDALVPVTLEGYGDALIHVSM